jgi:hypothetical protein
MDSIQRLERHWIFYPLYTLIRQKNVPDDTSKLRIDDARKFFDTIVKSLESMINPPFFIVNDLGVVIEALGGKMEGITKEEVRTYANQIRGYNEQLRTLKNSPNEFYSKEKCDCLEESCRRLTDFYTENHRVLVCEETPLETRD